MVRWAAQEGWNPGLDDAQAFYQADPEGFFVATLGNEIVACISVVNHTADMAFLGFYIVDPAFRGKGIGLELWNYAIRHAGQRTISLDGVPEQQANYRKSGFELSGQTTRFSASVQGAPSKEVTAASADDIATLIDMEATASGVAKTSFLTAWFEGTATRQTLIVKSEGRIIGLATVRQCQEGAKIGPLVAENAGTAEALIRHAATLFDGPLFIDLPGNALVLRQLCQEIGFFAGFETARMYRGSFDVPDAPIFAIATMEVG